MGDVPVERLEQQAHESASSPQHVTHQQGAKGGEGRVEKALDGNAIGVARGDEIALDRGSRTRFDALEGAHVCATIGDDIYASRVLLKEHPVAGIEPGEPELLCG